MIATRQIKVYVVHDDAVVRQTVAEFLGDLEYEAAALPAEDLEGLLEADLTEIRAAVVAQWEALGADPVARLRRIQARRPNVVFVVTADDDLPAREVAQYGVRTLFSHSVRLAELERALANLCVDMSP